MRSVVVAIALVLGLTGTAEARRGIVVVTYGSDYVHIRDVPEEEGGESSVWKLGYRYHRWGLFGLDFSRTEGEFILYRGDHQIPITDSKATALGASVPWKYRIPLGWIVIAAAIEFPLVIWKRRRVGIVLYLAGAMGLLSIMFLLLGLSPEFLIPAALAGHHAIGSMLALRFQKRIDEADNAIRRDLQLDEPPSPERKFEKAPLPTPPRLDDDPFRAPPAAKPIVTEKPPERPSTAPIVHDANAEQPKLLR